MSADTARRTSAIALLESARGEDVIHSEEKTLDLRVAEKEAEAFGDGAALKESKSDGKGDGEAKPKPASLLKLFRFASVRDVILLTFGTIFAILHGAGFPIAMLIFGQLTDAFIDQAITAALVDPDNINSTASFLALSYPSLSDVNVESLLSVNITTGSVDCDAQFNYENISLTLDEIITVYYGNGRECLGIQAFTDIIQVQCFIFIGIAVGTMLVSFFQSLFFQLVAERQVHLIRQNFYRSILRQNIGWFDANPSGELSSRLSDDIHKIEEGIGDKFSILIQLYASFLVAFIVAFTQEWRLTLVMLGFTPFIAAVAAIHGKLTSKFTTLEQKQYARAGAVAEEVLSSIRTVFAFAGEEKEVEKYNRKLTTATALGAKKGFFTGIILGIMFFLLFATYTVAFWFGAYLISAEIITAGEILTVFFAVLIGSFSLGQASPNMDLLQIALGAGGAIFDTIDRTPPIDVYSEEGEIADEFVGTVEFQDVEFAYPTRPDVPVLNQFSLKVDVGQTVALVGPSGCGKSTVVSLIERFYSILNGKVLVGGKEVSSLNLKWLRSNIGIVSQEPVLFDTTIAENIRFGKEGATMEEIQAAAKNANAHDFIMELPNGYHTQAGERGVQLSGGQKQRVAIARALVRNPKILLLDEATSALDTESEKTVQDALDKAREGRTTIVIAHRLSTIQTADVIASIEDGRVVEWGTHAELMDNEGLYYNLVTAQSYGADELFATSGAGRLLAMRQISKQPSETGGPAFQRQVSFQKQTSIVQKQTSQTAIPVLKRQVSTKKQEEWDKDIPPVSFGRVIKVNGKEWWLIIIGVFTAMINGSVFPLYSILFGEVLRVFQQRVDQVLDDITPWALLFLAMAVASGISIFFKTLCFAVSGDKLTARLRKMTFKAMLRQEVSWFDEERNSTGALTTRLASDAGQVQGVTGSRLSSMIETLTSLVLALIIAFIYSWVMTLFMVAIIPSLIIGGVIQGRILSTNIARSKKALENAGMVAVDSIDNIRTVAALGVEANFCQQYSDRVRTMYRTAVCNSFVYGFAYGFSQSLIFFMYAAVFRFGALLVTRPTDDIAYVEFFDIFRVFIAIVFGGAAIAQAGAFAPNYAMAKLSANRIFFLLDRKPLIDNYSEEGSKPEDVVGEVSANDLVFEYPSRPGVKVLQGLNVSVKPGQTLALVGPSGCGKSTVVSLIERFYDPLSGSLTLDGTDLKDLNIRWLRSQVGIVSQEPVLFDTNIAENIRYGANFREVSDEEVVEAAKAANIHTFIDSLPQGYSTNVGSKGTQLSGGQKQRIAIARALVRNPKILLLDEATSALDTESEKIVQEALDKAREGRTSIVIAHRLSTIYNANCIAVIKGGAVAEAGTHSELLKKRGIYFTLNRHQIVANEEELEM